MKAVRHNHDYRKSEMFCGADACSSVMLLKNIESLESAIKYAKQQR